MKAAHELPLTLLSEENDTLRRFSENVYRDWNKCPQAWRGWIEL